MLNKLGEINMGEFKRITLEEAESHYYPKPEGVSCTCAHAYTLTRDPDDELNDYVHYWIKNGTFNAALSFNEGYIYILGNKGQPGLLKIGYTDRTPQERVKEINGATGVITPWYVVNAFACRAPLQIESLVHKKLKPFHVSKEGFAVTLSHAEEIITSIISDNNANL
jgi:hypothetical protein